MRFLAASALTLALGAGLAPAIAAEGEPEINLRWALGALDAKGTSPTAIKRDTQLGNGSKLKFMVEPMSPCSVYLLLLDSSNEIHVLYRESPKPGKTVGAKPTYVPPGEQWFELDDAKGMETFFLLAAQDPLTGLEKMLDDYEKLDASKKDAGREAIVAEIRRLQKEHRNFARPVEKPVMIGGQTRGVEPVGIDHLAVEISAERFYDKTITIEH